MEDDHKESALPVKIFSLIVGFFTGGIYGLIVALTVSYFFKSNFDTNIIVWSAIVFSVVGVFKGNVVFELLLIMLHFFWGYVNGSYRPIVGHGNLERTEPEGYLSKIMWIGFATGLVIYLSKRHYF